MTLTGMSISSKDVATLLGTAPPAVEARFTRVAVLDDPDASGAITFAQGPAEERQPAVERSTAELMLLTLELAPFRRGPAIVVENPRLAIAKVVRRFLQKMPAPGISPLASVDPAARIGSRAHIGPFVVIGASVEIGDDAAILEHVVIRGPVRIGHRVYVKPHSVIGAEGFGVEFEPDGTPVRIPQIGGVIVGDDVEFGAVNTVCAGTLAPTIVEDQVKCDDHVHIAHNCRVGARSILTAGAILSGSVNVGSDCWLGPNTSVMNKIHLGVGTLAGLGAVVTESTESGVIVVGNPARVLRHR